MFAMSYNVSMYTVVMVIWSDLSCSQVSPACPASNCMKVFTLASVSEEYGQHYCYLVTHLVNIATVVHPTTTIIVIFFK